MEGRVSIVYYRLNSRGKEQAKRHFENRPTAPRNMGMHGKQPS
jgi:hypothetical protein